MANRSEQRIAILFVLPAVALVAVFRMFPLVWGFLLSFTSGDGAGGAKFVGLENRALTTDVAFHGSLINTLILLATLPVWVMLPLLPAILIHQGVPGGKLFRAGRATRTRRGQAWRSATGVRNGCCARHRCRWRCWHCRAFTRCFSPSTMR